MLPANTQVFDAASLTPAKIKHNEAVAFYANADRRLVHNYILAEFVPLAIAGRR